jgi:hypothetical protein
MECGTSVVGGESPQNSTVLSIAFHLQCGDAVR